MRFVRPLRAVVAAIGLAAAAASVAHATCDQRYRLTDIGDLGGVPTVALGLNNNGAVVGYATNRDGAIRAFHWTRATGMHSLAPRFESSVAIDVNDADQILVIRSGGGVEEAVLRSLSGVPASVVLPSFGGPQTQPFAVNNRGRVVGWSLDADDQAQAFRWLPGQPRLQGLGALPPDDQSFATDVNGSGLVVGASLGDGSRAFVWSPGTGALVALAKTGFSGSFANGVNDRGQIVGEVEDADDLRYAVLWPATDAEPRLLGTFGRESVANKINKAGVVVGWSSVPPKPGDPMVERRAFVWSAACGLRDLNDLVAAGGGVVLNDAQAINRSGQIAVNGTRGKALRGYLLTPIRDAAD